MRFHLLSLSPLTVGLTGGLTSGLALGLALTTLPACNKDKSQDSDSQAETGSDDTDTADTDTDDSDTEDTDTDTADTDTDDTADTDTSPADDADGDGVSAADGDCDDANDAIYPGAAEVCDGADNDCNSAVDDGVLTTWYQDDDADGYGQDGASLDACSAPAGYSGASGDCDDTEPTWHPGADESDCTDPSDYNCDGSVGAIDNDADGFYACEDCDDDNFGVNPTAAEVCNGVDDNCDTVVDTDAVDMSTYYADADGDGYGDDSTAILSCDGTGLTGLGGDCDDSLDTFNPAADESDCTDPADYNCDGGTGYVDADADGYAACEECDDSNAAVNADGLELCDGVDNDCDGTVDENDSGDASIFYLDSDSDGFGDDTMTFSGCAAPVGYVGVGGDCDDALSAFNPEATEVCNGVDDNCDTLVDTDAVDMSTFYTDADGDGYGDDATSAVSCNGAGRVAIGGDCDDTLATFNPAADESDCTDPSDYNCDGGTSYADADLDGYAACEECDDDDGTVNPDAVELCDGVDNDCDGTVDEDDASDASTLFLDADGDGYGDDTAQISACGPVAGFVDVGADCDDTAADVNDSATEACDGIDNNCDGAIDEPGATGERTWYLDGDVDGYGDIGSPFTGCDAPVGYVADATDCDDTDAGFNPGAAEVCTDPTDYNCDGSTGYVDSDGDGAPACEDCDDDNADARPGGSEVCDGADNDCDGTVDIGSLDVTA